MKSIPKGWEIIDETKQEEKCSCIDQAGWDFLLEIESMTFNPRKLWKAQKKLAQLKDEDIEALRKYLEALENFYTWFTLYNDVKIEREQLS